MASAAVPTSRLSKQSDVTVELAVFVDNELWRKYQTDHGAYADSQLQDFVMAILNNVIVFANANFHSEKKNFQKLLVS